jgi:hypothetical protein
MRVVGAMRAPLLILAALLLTWLLAPLVPEPRSVMSFRVAAYGTSAVFFALVALLVGTLAPPTLGLPGRRIVVIVVLSFACVLGLNYLQVPVASDVAKLALGISAGAGLLLPIDRPWWLLPICVCVPLADAWSVFSARGVTHAVVEHAASNPQWLAWPTIATPIAGYDYLEFGRIGIVDILFLTLFLAAGIRWELGVRRLLVALPLAFVATNVLAYELDGPAVPALPILCIAFLACTGRRLWRDLRSEFARNDPTPEA